MGTNIEEPPITTTITPAAAAAASSSISTSSSLSGTTTTFFNNQQMYNQFVNEVNLQSLYNKNGCINAVPIVVYHNFTVDKNYIEQPNMSVTDTGLFSDEMKYFSVKKRMKNGVN